ncbi:hypothetical protein [Cysteiniphilum litorale]|uniref:hypothetical protein n=1 Tax=Cysteiniphilum litorale TaxID=2056700 RepID=UPI003F883E6D
MKKSIKLSLYSSMMAIVLTGQVNALESPTASVTTTVSASVPVTFDSNVAFVLYDGNGTSPQLNPASFALTLGVNASVNTANDVAGTNLIGVYTGLKLPYNDANSVSTGHFDTEALKWLAIYEEQSNKAITALDIKFIGLDAAAKTVKGKKLYPVVFYPFDGSVMTIADKAGVTLGTSDVPATAINAAKVNDVWGVTLGGSNTLTIADQIATDKVAYIPLAFTVGSNEVSTISEYLNTFGDSSSYSFTGISVQLKATFS